MSFESHSTDRCLFPINPRGLQISHPVIGSFIQSHDDFYTRYNDDEPLTGYVAPLLDSEEQTDSEETVLITVKLRRNDISLAIETTLSKYARHISIVVPRDLLASDALTLFDIRLNKSYPNAIASHIIDTVEIVTYLLGDGIASSWRG